MQRRRRYLTTLAAGAAGLVAGCTDGGSESTPTPTVNVTDSSDSTRLSVPVDGDEGLDSFGETVALDRDGTTALVGAPGEGTDGETFVGSAYVFAREGSEWTRAAELTAPDRTGADFFGCSVALSADGSTALVGAYGDDVGGSRMAGAAYVFSDDDGSWTRHARLIATDNDAEDKFGASAALSADGSTALLGAPEDEDPNGSYGGAGYVFGVADGTWSQTAKLATADGDFDDYVGRSVALSADGSTALLGADGVTESGAYGTGAAYVFSAADGEWRQRATLSAADGDGRDFFGVAVALSGDGTTALVGADSDEDPNGDVAGSAYVFTAEGGAWGQRAKLTADDGDGNDWFGHAVALDETGTTALVGAPKDEDPNGPEAGSAYLFSPADGWTQRSKLSAGEGERYDEFGTAVALDATGERRLVGAVYDRVSGAMEGSAYVFE